MSAMFFLIGCSVFIALVFLGAFIWSNKSGQNDDTHTPAMRILFDDAPHSADTEPENTGESLKKQSIKPKADSTSSTSG